MLDKIFWILTTIEGAVSATLLVYFLMHPGLASNDNLEGVYLTLVPLVTLTPVAIAYRLTKSPVVQGVLLILPLLWTLPGLNAAFNYYGSIVENYETKLGIGLFADPGVSTLLKAIGKRDEAQVRRLAQTVDVNATTPEVWLHPSPYTPIRFAVERALAAERDGKYVSEARRMVEVLLSLGAKPSPALIYACGSTGTGLTRMLLDAGADANYETVRLLSFNETTRALPFYGCGESRDSALGNLELLASRGARFMLLDPPKPYLMRTVILNKRWDQALFLYDHGFPMETDLAMRQVVEKAIEAAGKPDAQLLRMQELVKQQQ